MKTDSKCFNDKLGWVNSTSFIITNYIQINDFPTSYYETNYYLTRRKQRLNKLGITKSTLSSHTIT